MRTIPRHVTICPRHTRGAVPLETSATEEPAASTSPRASAGTAKERGPLPSAFAAPVLIHHPSNTSADGGEAPSVLLLDGPPGTPFMWHRVLPVLRSRGVQPCTVKRPGNPAIAGQAEDPFTTAAEIAQLLEDQQLCPAVIVGYRFGAGTALALAASAPRHVRGLVLVAPAAGLQSISIADRLLAAPMLGPVMTWLGFRLAGLALHLPGLRRAILTTRAGLNAGDAKQFVRHITFGSTWRTFVSEQRRLVSDARRRNQQLSRIDCPVLIVDGTRDRIVGPRTGTALRRLLPGSEVMTTAAAGHLIPIDDPDSVADAVLRALRYEYRTSLSARSFKRQRPQARVQSPIHGNRDQA
jgi:2-succinyl-6-hydroxy-2,4-cyclohexadiene-1-carboxylate synthase